MGAADLGGGNCVPVRDFVQEIRCLVVYIDVGRSVVVRLFGRVSAYLALQSLI